MESAKLPVARLAAELFRAIAHPVRVWVLGVLLQLQVLDSTGARGISEIVHALERRGITVLVKGIQPRHFELAERVGVLAALRHANHLFDDLDAAVEHARSHVLRSIAAEKCAPAQKVTASTKPAAPKQPAARTPAARAAARSTVAGATKPTGDAKSQGGASE